MTLHRYAKFLSFVTFLLIVAGGLVTSTGSALAVPDWPLSFGRFFPRMVGGVLFEHGHRMMAGTVGLLTLVLAFWMARGEKRRWVRGFGWAALGAVALQALLGGITVLYQLPAPVSVLHATLGQIFFCLVVTVAVVTSKSWAAPPPFPSPSRGEGTGEGGVSLPTLSLLTTVAVLIQLVLGAVLRHSSSGLAAHALWALVVGGLVFWMAGRVLIECAAERAMTRAAQGLAALALLQLGLGLYTGFVRRAILFATAHVAIGALILALSWGVTLCAFRLFSNGVASRLSGYLELTKPRITAMVLITTLAGFFIAWASSGDRSRDLLGLLAATLAGTALVVGGANALNQYLERDSDSVMKRTRVRPLPQKRLAPRHALLFGLSIAAAGMLILAFSVNRTSALLALLAFFSYVLVYTPLKKRTALNTLVGAVPGAIPPVLGYAAAGVALGMEAGILFAILFLWQLPHFLAIAWLYKEDYARAGFPMLPVIDPGGDQTSRSVTFYCFALLAVSLLPSLLGLTGPVYFYGALALGLTLVGFGFGLALARSSVQARRLFIASDIYLPALLALMLIGKF